MATFAELIAATQWVEIKAALAWFYPEEGPRVEGYRIVLRELRTLEPEANAMRIAIQQRPPGLELDAMSEEEKAEKLIPLEQVMAEFKQGKDN